MADVLAGSLAKAKGRGSIAKQPPAAAGGGLLGPPPPTASVPATPTERTVLAAASQSAAAAAMPEEHIDAKIKRLDAAISRLTALGMDEVQPVIA